MDDNRRIFDWLGYHLHSGVNVAVKCGCVPNWYDKIPQYDTDPAAMLELLEAVRAKGYDIDINITATGVYDVGFCINGNYILANNFSYDTFPAAIVKAVIALINSIEGETKC